METTCKEEKEFWEESTFAWLRFVRLRGFLSDAVRSRWLSLKLDRGKVALTAGNKFLGYLKDKRILGSRISCCLDR